MVSIVSMVSMVSIVSMLCEYDVEYHLHQQQRLLRCPPTAHCSLRLPEVPIEGIVVVQIGLDGGQIHIHILELCGVSQLISDQHLA
jgi:hypothetical protein